MASSNSRLYFIVPALFVLLGVITLWSARTGRPETGPFDGRRNAVLQVAAPDGGGVGAAKNLVERLLLLGVHAEAADVAESGFKLRLYRVAEPREAVLAAMKPDAIRLQVIADDQSAPTDAAIALEAQVQPMTVVVPPAEALEPFLKATSRAELNEKLAQTPPPPEREAVPECTPAPEKSTITALCAAWLTWPAASLSGQNVTASKISADRQTEEPLVTFMLDEAGARELERLTSENVGRQLGVVALGELQARPEITGTVTGGTWTFTTRTGDTDRPAAISRAQRVSAATKLERLPRLVIDSVEYEEPRRR